MAKSKDIDPKPRGRPSTYNHDIAIEILGLIESGDGLNKICKDERFPPESTVRRWVTDDVNGFAAKYARARDIRADVLAEQVIDIADTELDPAIAKVRIDARKWYAGKVAARYSDKLTTVVTGPNGGPVQHLDVSTMSDDDLRKLAALDGSEPL